MTYFHGGPEKPSRQTLTLTDKPYDRVWEACERSLVQLGFEFYSSDKDKGEIRVRSVVDDPRYADYTKDTVGVPALASVSDVLLSVTMADGQISLTISCTHYRSPANYFTAWEISELALEKQQKEIDRIVRAIKKRLSK